MTETTTTTTGPPPGCPNTPGWEPPRPDMGDSFQALHDDAAGRWIVAGNNWDTGAAKLAGLADRLGPQPTGGIAKQTAHDLRRELRARNGLDGAHEPTASCGCSAAGPTAYERMIAVLHDPAATFQDRFQAIEDNAAAYRTARNAAAAEQRIAEPANAEERAYLDGYRAGIHDTFDHPPAQWRDDARRNAWYSGRRHGTAKAQAARNERRAQDDVAEAAAGLWERMGETHRRNRAA